MFGTIRRHQQWIWIPIITVIIISFVWFFLPSGSGTPRFSGPNYTYVNGKLATINGQGIPLDEFQSAKIEAKLFHFFRNGGRWTETDEETLDRDAIIRVFMLRKLKELGITASDKAADRLTMERLGNYPIASLEKEHLTPHQVTLADFDRFMHHEAAIQELVGVVTASAKLIKPEEAEILYRKQHEATAAELAVFWSSNYLDKVVVTPAGVSNFYTMHMADYRVPERVQVNYVEFNASNYLAEAEKKISEMTNYSALIDKAYAARDTNAAFFKETGGKPLEEAAAKAKLRAEDQKHEALKMAYRKASEFGNELYNQPQPERADNLEKMAATNRLPVKVTPPFDFTSGLDDTNFPSEFREKALALTKESPILFNPIKGDEAIYIIALKNRVPSEMPPLAKVEEKVTADYKKAQAWELARAEGTNFAAIATNGLAQKKPFTALCEQAKVKPIVLPPFSATSPLTNLDERINGYVERISSMLKPGEASPFYPLPMARREEGGLLVYLRAKIPVDEAKVKTELSDFMGQLRVYRQNEDFNQWFSRQAELAKLVIPRKENPSIAPGS